jgi:hypothetical protein
MKVAGSSADKVIEIVQLLDPSSRGNVLRFTQPLTELS